MATPFIGFVIFLCYTPVLRAAHVYYRAAATRGGAPSPFVAAVSNDIVITASLLALAGFAILSGNARARKIAFLVVASVQFLMLVDLLVFREFSQRLTLPDFQKYVFYAGVYLLDFPPARVVGGVALTAGYALCAIWAYRFLVREPGSRRIAVHLFSLSFLALVGFTGRPEITYVHSRTYFANFIDYNRAIWSERRGYSPGFVDSLDASEIRETCGPVPATTGPVIVYMVESLSSYQSRLFGGVLDWTPRLDSIGRTHTAFVNFLSNGFTTEDAEIALLTGQPPIFPPNTLSMGGGSSFGGYWDLDETLPKAMRDAGYQTAFLTTADLGFSATGEWAHSVGFGFVEGSDGRAYDGQRRYHFDAAADEALVQRVLAYVSGAGDRAFVFVKTVTSHHPFVDPVTGDPSEESTVRYVDRQIDALVRGLERTGFFGSGHLIIVGDHRAMTPLRGFEVDTWGAEVALARVPAVVVSETFMPDAGLVEEEFSQVDLSGSLMARFAGKKCGSEFREMIGERRDTPIFRIHRRGDLRNALSVFGDGRYGSILLDGDETRFTTSDFSSGEESRILRYVNYRRIQAARNAGRIAVGTGGAP